MNSEKEKIIEPNKDSINKSDEVAEAVVGKILEFLGKATVFAIILVFIKYGLSE